MRKRVLNSYKCKTIITYIFFFNNEKKCAYSVHIHNYKYACRYTCNKQNNLVFKTNNPPVLLPHSTDKERADTHITLLCIIILDGVHLFLYITRLLFILNIQHSSLGGGGGVGVELVN